MYPTGRTFWDPVRRPPPIFLAAGSGFKRSGYSGPSARRGPTCAQSCDLLFSASALVRQKPPPWNSQRGLPTPAAQRRPALSSPVGPTAVAQVKPFATPAGRPAPAPRRRWESIAEALRPLDPGCRKLMGRRRRQSPDRPAMTHARIRLPAGWRDYVPLLFPPRDGRSPKPAKTVRPAKSRVPCSPDAAWNPPNRRTLETAAAAAPSINPALWAPAPLVQSTACSLGRPGGDLAAPPRPRRRSWTPPNWADRRRRDALRSGLNTRTPRVGGAGSEGGRRWWILPAYFLKVRPRRPLFSPTERRLAGPAAALSPTLSKPLALCAWRSALFRRVEQPRWATPGIGPHASSVRARRMYTSPLVPLP